MNCPTHQTPMQSCSTQYGLRFRCTSPGCTVACWDGPTSLPGDDETRDLRRRCHALFDPLWQGKTRFRTRKRAYEWLQRFMGLSVHKAHIGMFDRERCLKLLAELEKQP